MKGIVKDKGFQNTTRRKARNQLFKELSKVVHRYGQLNSYDKLHVLGIIKSKIKENDKNG